MRARYDAKCRNRASCYMILKEWLTSMARYRQSAVALSSLSRNNRIFPLLSFPPSPLIERHPPHSIFLILLKRASQRLADAHLRQESLAMAAWSSCHISRVALHVCHNGRVAYECGRL